MCQATCIANFPYGQGAAKCFFLAFMKLMKIQSTFIVKIFFFSSVVIGKVIEHSNFSIGFSTYFSIRFDALRCVHFSLQFFRPRTPGPE